MKNSVISCEKPTSLPVKKIKNTCVKIQNGRENATKTVKSRRGKRFLPVKKNPKYGKKIGFTYTLGFHAQNKHWIWDGRGP